MKKPENKRTISILQKYTCSALAFLVLFTQVVSYPFAYVLNLEYRNTAEAAGPEEEFLDILEQPQTPVDRDQSDVNAARAVLEKKMGNVSETVLPRLAKAQSGPTPQVNTANPPNSPITTYDLVTLVVEKGLYDDLSSYTGITDQESSLQANTFRERILRFAEDLRSNNAYTDVKVLQYDANLQDVKDVALALENLYKNGEPGRSNRLAGVILVGDVPLPVVNKAGNSFISLFPYTDFSDKLYLFNEKSKSFELNEKAVFPGPEVWHGVLRAPTANDAGLEKLAAYFDKNHLYYEGDPDYSDFRRKLFYADLVAEEEMTNADIYKQYLQYLDSQEDLSYMRFNKHWASEVSQKTSGEIEINADNPQATEFAAQLEGQDPLSFIPDMHTVQPIRNALMGYSKILERFISKANDLADSTGRYDTKSIDTMPEFVEMKDEYSAYYLRSANDALEKKMNEVVQLIQEPLPLVEYSNLSGQFGTSQPFSVQLSGDGVFPGESVAGMQYRFHYLNEINNKLYINGVEGDILASPKQCSVYLGSTKNEYFNSNLDFDPKAVDGEYSILTRALRTDDLRTFTPVQTTGVNTRLISAEEGLNRTGVETEGAVVEDNLNLGIAAFAPSQHDENYVNPLDGPLQRGDVIVKVNDRDINARSSFEAAIERSFTDTKNVMDAVNGKNLDLLSDFPYEIVNLDGRALSDADINMIVGRISIEFYRGSDLRKELFTFTVRKDGLAGGGDAQGNPELMVDLTDEPGKIGEDDKSDAVIFTLYNSSDDRDNKGGYDARGYDNSAGCSQNSASDNGDRCFAKVAMMPVLQPAGAVSLIKTTNALGITQLQFPENIGEEGIPAFVDHYNQFQYPDYYSYEDIDELYLDSCYSGLPALPLDVDSNHFDFPLQPDTTAGTDVKSVDQDWYGRLLKGFGYFVRDNGAKKDVSPSISDVWQDLNTFDAADVVLNNAGEVVTLKEFSDRYGLFDGIDNDGDGIADFEWRDSDGDGVYETKFQDFDEADAQYGLPSNAMDMIARKMLARPGSYTIRAALTDFNEDITLTVQPNLYKDKTFSSAILHNEPTPDTIMQQVLSRMAYSLPIDNPRYIAFQSAPKEIEADGPIAPAGVSNQPHFMPGDLERVDYVNLFDTESYGELQAKLTVLANQLASVPGAYRVLGPSGNENSALVEIRDEILNTYFLPTINGNEDQPASGINLTRADGNKIADSLEWINLDIDSKHEYIFAHYLNENEEAYIHDDTRGFEAAYLVMRGGGDSFDMGFNKGRPEELDARFNPLSLEQAGADLGPLPDSGSSPGDIYTTEAPSDEGFGEDDVGYVDLFQFIKELEEFINGFVDLVNYVNPAQFLAEEEAKRAAEDEEDVRQEQGIPEPVQLPLASMQTELERNVLAVGGERLVVNIRGADSNGDSYLGSGQEVQLTINQDDDAPVLELAGGDRTVMADGVATFTLSTTSNPGSATLNAVSTSGINAGAVSISTTATNIDLASFTAFKIDESLEDVENPFEEAESSPGSNYIIDPGAQLVADGESMMMVTAAVRDAEGAIADSLNGQVRFSVVGEENLVEFVDGDTVSLESGVATAYLKAGTKAAPFKLMAEVLSPGYPIVEADLMTVADEPTEIEIQPDSTVLLNNGESKTTVNFVLKDANGNVANNAFTKVSVFLSGDTVSIAESRDTNAQIPGTQLNVSEGVATVELKPGEEMGPSSLVALLMDFELEREFAQAENASEDIDFSQHVSSVMDFRQIDEDDFDLNLIWDKSAIVANGLDLAKLRIETTVDGSNFGGYNGPIEVKLLNGNLGHFVTEAPKKMVDGVLHEQNVRVRAGTDTGELELQVSLPSFMTKSTTLELRAGEARKIALVPGAEVIQSSSNESMQLEALILDNYDNVVESDNSSSIIFSATDSTADLIDFSNGSATVSGGRAVIEVSGREASGEVNIVANAAGLSSDFLTMQVVKRVYSDRVAEFAPKALYMSVLGGAFGNLGVENNIGETLLYSGKVQAVSAVTASKTDKKRLVGVDAYGKLTVLSDTVEAEAFAASSNFPFQKVIFNDSLAGEEILSVFMVPKPALQLSLVGEEEEMPEAEGIYVKRESNADVEIEFVEDEKGVTIKKGEDSMMNIDPFGRVKLLDESLELNYPLTEEDDFENSDFALVVYDKGEILVSITYQQDFDKDVQIIEFGEEFTAPFVPGIYVREGSSEPKYELAEAFSRASTMDDKGVYLIDSTLELDPLQAPGLNYNSLENAAAGMGMGFKGDNKHMLLFSGGNSVGESNLPYASEVGIILGDPMIHLEVDDDLVSSLTGYSKDVGKPILDGLDVIENMIDLDLNGDGLDDLLAVYEDGLVRYLENENSPQRYRDQGIILNIFGGVTSSAKIDVNNDGYDDLIIGSNESCTVGEDVHMTLYTNVNGSFEGEPLELDIVGKPQEIKSRDMNVDGCEDLVVSDSAGNIRIFYNEVNGGQCVGLNEEHGYSRNFGVEVDADSNQAGSIYVNYPGMEELAGDLSNADKFIEFVLQSDEPNPALEGIDLPDQGVSKGFNFINLPEDIRLAGGSEKTSRDLNGSTINIGDEIEYLITLKNGSNQTINDLRLSDIFPNNMTLNLDSLECLDAGCEDNLDWIESGVQTRDWIITGITIPGQGQRNIRYTMTVEQVPEVSFDLGNDFTTYPNRNNDGIPDIFVKPEVNPTGVQTYLYSTGISGDGEVTYARFIQQPEGEGYNGVDAERESMGLPPLSDLLATIPPPSPGPEPEPDENGLVMPPEEPLEVPDSVLEQLATYSQAQTVDENYDGCVDSWTAFNDGVSQGLDDFNNAAGQIGDGIENLTSFLRCSGGGCFPIPYNYAFLAPSAFPGDPAVGLAVLAGLVPDPLIPVRPAWSYEPASFFKLYVNPTLTGGIGGAVCGPSVGLQGPCYPYAVPLQALGVCPDITGAIGDAIAAAKESVSDTDSGMSTIISDGNAPTDTDTFSSNFAYDEPDSPWVLNNNVNIRIPGFPAVITDWLDAQVDEIYNKLMDLPDIYVIYPDPRTLVPEFTQASNNFAQMQNLTDFLRSVNSIPLIQIESREITMRVPAISLAEIQKYKHQAYLWIEYHKDQIERIKRFWTCDESQDQRTFCDSLILEIDGMIKSVNNLMNELDNLANMPYQILDWRTVESKYASQIIAYMDAIMEFTGGYINRQQIIIGAWMKTIEDVIRMFRDWKLILDLLIEYQVSCDRCTSDRLSLLGLILSLFAVIPEPPVIPLPKWPDIVFDMSQLKTGIKIVWPDIVFRPEPLRLPDLPVINLPFLMPEINFEIPFELDIDLDLPDFNLPPLPDLPPLPLPELPDLPRPIKLPQLPDFVAKIAVSLKTIFRILCLLKNALIPVPEFALKTEIETLTQPSIRVVLPILKELSFKIPSIEYDYLEQIRITMKMSFGIDTNFIYGMAKIGIDRWNDSVEGLIDKLNEITQIPLQEIVDKFIQDSIDGLVDAATDEVFGGESGVEVDDRTETSLDLAHSGFGTDGFDPESMEIQEFAEHSRELALLNESFMDMSSAINEYSAAMQEVVDQYPDTYQLEAKQRFIDSSHPLVARSVEEVEAGMRLQELPDTPEMKQMIAMRGALIDYAKNLDKSNSLMEEIKDYNGDFSKILVQSDSSLRQIAALSTDQFEVEVSQEESTSLFGKAAEEAIRDTGLLDTKRQLAATFDPASFDPVAAVSDQASQHTGAAKGFYVAVAGGQSENVLMYTDELNEPMKTLFSDVDNDGDEDLVYSMGTDIFLKISHENDADEGLGNLSNDQLGEYLGVEDSVQGVAAPFESHEKADVSWLADEDAVAYEVVLQDSFRSGSNGVVKTYLALVHEAEADENERILARFGVDASDVSSEEENENLKDGELGVKLLSDPENPKISLEEIENGFYYTVVYALNEDGERSLVSDIALLSPQICGDSDAPFPVVNSDANNNFDVPIFSSLVIDARSSFDTSGEIVEYTLEVIPRDAEGLETTNLPAELGSDVNNLLDSNGDGVASNDKDNPMFRLGPFEKEGDIGEWEMILRLVDQSGNESEMPITVNVFVPDISLDETISRIPIASGEIDPMLEEMPFSLMRDRLIYRVFNGKLTVSPRAEKVVTESIGEREKYYTDERGEYEIRDMELDDMILVENEVPSVVAEIDPETANIGALADGHAVRVNEAEVPTAGTNLEILDADGNPLAEVYPVANPNVDVILQEEVDFDSEEFRFVYGVHANDLDLSDQFVLKKIPGDDPAYPGGAKLVYLEENINVLLVDTAGNLVTLDERVGLVHKENDHRDDPLVIEVRFDGRAVAEIMIKPNLGIGGAAVIVDEPSVPFMDPREPTNSSLYGAAGASGVEVLGLDANLSAAAEDLLQKGIFEANITDAGVILNGDEVISRKEFVKTLLVLLCIVSRESAYQPFVAGEADGGFSDLPGPDSLESDYFAYIKEAALLGLVDGYVGERNEAGLAPFKPDEIITRAEATKVILEALQLKGVVDISAVQPGEPWYEPFMEVAEDLNPYVTDGEVLLNNFIVTDEESESPNVAMAFRDAIAMAERVLSFYNCFEIDEDANGLSDHCEEKYGISDPEADEDQDGLKNADECFYNLNPLDGDSDGGGVGDGEEIEFGTNPLNAVDDPIDIDGDGLTDRAEELIYGTDPGNPDTDGGGVRDGEEVERKMDPLDASDDQQNPEDDAGDRDPLAGIYVVPANCLSCPCQSNLTHSGDIIPGDVFYTLISNFEETQVFAKSNEVVIDTVNKE